MKSKIILSLFFALLFATLIGCSDGSHGDTIPRSFDVVSGGDMTGGGNLNTDLSISSNMEHVVNNAEEWQALFADVEMPEVGFESDSLVVIFMGERPTTGYSIEITSITQHIKGDVTVYVEKKSPGANCSVATIVSYPYTVVKTKKISDPVTVTYEYSDAIADCSAGKATSVNQTLLCE